MDYISQILVQYPPTKSIFDVVRLFKQMSTYNIWRQNNNHIYLKKQFWSENTFWGDGYFACSIGQVSKETIENTYKIKDEYLIRCKNNSKWENMLFDDLIKNMENNKDLYECLYNILILNINQMFNINYPVIELGHMLGYLIADRDNNVTVSNQIIKEVIYKTNNKWCGF